MKALGYFGVSADPVETLPVHLLSINRQVAKFYTVKLPVNCILKHIINAASVVILKFSNACKRSRFSRL